MRRTGLRELFLRVPLLAALTVAFVVMTLAQPGVHALAKPGISVAGVEAAEAVHETTHPAENGHGGMHRHVHKAASAADDAPEEACDVQCAPVSLVLADACGLRAVLARCYGSLDLSKLAGDAFPGPTRPPRSVI